ncbi:MAG: hypothetical protein ACRDG4_04605 [Chloroflexota bacterium]
MASNAAALAIVEDALDHTAVRVRLTACRAIADVASMSTAPLPAPLAAYRAQVARAARTTSGLALEAARHHQLDRLRETDT